MAEANLDSPALEKRIAKAMAELTDETPALCLGLIWQCSGIIASTPAPDACGIGVMARRGRRGVNHTAALLALLANVNRDPRRAAIHTERFSSDGGQVRERQVP